MRKRCAKSAWQFVLCGVRNSVFYAFERDQNKTSAQQGDGEICFRMQRFAKLRPQA
jgi:hypothetical protein